MKDGLDRRLWNRGINRLCGVDEVGRGALAGPVVSAAVILPSFVQIPGLDDSKRLTPKARARLFTEIRALALDYGIALVGPRRVDRLNIRRASFASMVKALSRLKLSPQLVLVDGFKLPGLSLPQIGVVGGDRRSFSIAAASILAKVTRDRIMTIWHTRYPDYGFAQNKGYPTLAHRRALMNLGPSAIHRKTFHYGTKRSGR